MSIACAEFATMLPPTSVQNQPFVPRPKKTRAGLLHCLVVSPRDERRSFLAVAAEAAGWEVTVCEEAEVASMAAKRTRFALSMVDLDGLSAEETSRYRLLTEELSRAPSPLVMICGRDGDALEELWARQLGAWLYLAGVDATCDVESLCMEAKQVTEKLSATSRRRSA